MTVMKQTACLLLSRSSTTTTTTDDKKRKPLQQERSHHSNTTTKRRHRGSSVVVAGSVLLVLSSHSFLSWVESAAPHGHPPKNNWFREILHKAIPATRRRGQYNGPKFPPTAGDDWNDRLHGRDYESNTEDVHSEKYFDDYESLLSTTGISDTTSSSRSPTIPRKTLFPGVTWTVEKLSSSAEASLRSAFSGTPQQIQENLTASLHRFAGIYCRIGFSAFLGYTLYHMFREIVQDMRSTAAAQRTAVGADADADGIETMPAFTPLQVQDMVESCFVRNNNATYPKKSEPTLLRVALKLLTMGLPLQSTDTDTRPAVEAILLQLTRAEVQMLEKCLWTVPLQDENQRVRASSDDPSPINPDAAWNHIAGLRSVQQGLRRTLKLLLQESQQRGDNDANDGREGDFASLFSSSDFPSSQNNKSVSSRKVAGVLLYGPPGCGKTLLVKALANTGGVPCLVVTPSVLLSKYVGETNQRVRTLFSLAAKLGPCVLCLDELDGLLRERHDDEHDVSRELKTEFLQWWDGLLQGTSSGSASSSSSHPIFVLGATNRPFDVDAAVLRRFPQSHYVGLPCVHARYQLLKQWLAPPMPVQVDWNLLAERTKGYTPSDLRHALQAAVMAGPMQRRDNCNNGEDDDAAANAPFLTTQDVLQALRERPPTPLSAQYQRQLSKFARRGAVEPYNDEQDEEEGALSSSHQMYDESSSFTTLESGAIKWETRQGNFYNIGTLEIDSTTLDILTELSKNIDMEHYYSTNDNSDDEDDDEDELS